MSKLWGALKGVKTYAIAASGLLYAGVHYFYLGDMSSKDAVELAIGSAGLGTLRHGLSTQMVAMLEQFGPAMLDAMKQNAGKTAIALLLGSSLALGGCAQLGLTGNPTKDAPKIFADACYALDTANGMFLADAPIFRLTQAQIGQETAIYAVSHRECVAPPVDMNASGTPILDANGNPVIDYQRLAIDIANATAAIYLIVSPPTAGSPAAAIITHRH